jgi:cytochrome c peroxidase
MARLIFGCFAAAISGVFVLAAPPAATLPHARSFPVTLPPAGKSIPVGKRVEIKIPLGLPPLSIPEDNPPTEETIALGRKLFFDKVLSRDGTISCASCHDPKHGFADPDPVSKGIRGQKGTRNAMTVLNAAYHFTQFWDGRAATLEEQARGPVANPVEMGHSLVGIERKLQASPEYAALFEKAFGPGRITYDMVAKSIASYERTLLSGNSPFDRYFYGGDKSALSASAERGLRLFLNKTLNGPNCVSCHTILDDGATFTEVRFHNTGVAFNEKLGLFTDPGRFGVTQTAHHQGAFKVPTLRNIALTAPYMHNGSMKTLEEVVDFYFEGGRHNQFISGVMPHPPITVIGKDEIPQAKKDLVEFLKALTGEMPESGKPPVEKSR